MSFPPGQRHGTVFAFPRTWLRSSKPSTELVMISHQHKCIFIHIPKNAGQSIEHVFLKWAGLTWKTRAPLLLRPNSDPAQGPPRLAHLKASEYVRCGHLEPQQFASFLEILVCEKPVGNSMASFYKYLGSPERQTFKEFITGQFQSEFWPAKYWFVGPRSEYIYDSHDRLMVDYLGKFETLQADFNSVCEKLGVPHTPVPAPSSINRSCTAGCVGCFRRSCPEPGAGTQSTPLEKRGILRRGIR